jgi:Flp pilus assembly pilin Flp
MWKCKFGFAGFRRLKKNDDGSSAVEFGMIAPILVFGVLASVDLGVAIGERMEMDHIVRAGAESAMIKYDEDDVLKVMTTTAEKNFSVASESEDGGDNTYEGGISYPVSLSVNQYCACGDAPTVEVSCSNICTGDLPPNVYFDVGATKTYHGMIIPDLSFDAAMRVQLR